MSSLHNTTERDAPATSASDLLALARRLEESVSLAPTTEAETARSGPFRAFFSPHTADPELNYAMPVAPLGAGPELASAVADLRRLFAGRGRRPRLEFVSALWPELPAALEQAGLRLVGDEPLMICMPDSFTPAAAPDVAVRALAVADPDADLATFLLIRDEEERAGQPPSAQEIARLRQSIAAGQGVFALATLDGQPTGTGRCQYSGGGLGEISAIVTQPALRRRGVAATVTSFLLRELFAAGGTLAWLSAANDGARSVYARLGFQGIGSLLNYEETAE